MSGPPLTRRRVVVRVSVVYLALGAVMPWKRMCTTNCGVTAGVAVAVAVAVRVAGHGSGREVIPLALIIQLPGIVGLRSSITPAVSLMGSPRLATLGAAPLPLPTTQERCCEGAVASSAAGKNLGWNEPDSAQKS